MNELKRNLVAALTRGEYGMLCKTHQETVLAIPMNLSEISKGNLITSDRIIGKMRRALSIMTKRYAKNLSDNHHILVWVEDGMLDEKDTRVISNTTETGMISYYFTIHVATRKMLDEKKQGRLLAKVNNLIEDRAMVVVERAIKEINREEDRDIMYEELLGN